MKKFRIIPASLALGAIFLTSISCTRPADEVKKVKTSSVPTKKNEDSTIISIAQKVYSIWEKRASQRNVIVVDFSKPMEKERLYVVNLDSSKVILRSRVCHGVGSGKSSVPTRFSNTEGSKMSSKGVMLTGETFYSSYGYSMAVDGLQRGINSQARRREIIFHSSDKQKTSWSWGCFSTPGEFNKKIIDLTKNGCLLFSYSNSLDLEKI